MLKAVQSNSVQSIRHLHRRGVGWSERMQKRLSREAASLGHLEALACLHELGCAWHDEACVAAAQGGHLDVLVFLHEHGCPWTLRGREREPWVAVKRGDLAMFKYLCDKGCPVHPRRYSDSSSLANVGCVYSYAARKGHVHMLAHLHENAFPITEHYAPGRHPVFVRVAAQHGQQRCLLYMRSKGYEWNESTIAAAASNGHLACVTLLHEYGCPWSSEACRKAVKGGHLACLMYLHEHGCPWDEWVSEVCIREQVRWRVADAARLSCLRYMLAHGCPLSRISFPSSLLPDIREACIKLIAKHLLLPRWREAVRWMIKVRPYAWHWYEEHQRVQCAPGGEGRTRDRDEFVEEMEPVICS